MARSKAWQLVADAYHGELADALAAREWVAIEAMLTPEFVAAVQAKDWEKVGDEYGDLDTAHLIRAALLGSIDSEPAVLDAIRRGAKGDLETVKSMQTAKRAAIVNNGDGKVGY